MSIVLLAVWLPATVHCELEAAEIVPMDECCETEGQGAHRCESGCNVIEDGGIKTECQNTLAIPPQICITLPDLSDRMPDIMEQKRPHPESFKIHHLPQFVIRTALPIRGPSSAS